MRVLSRILASAALLLASPLAGGAQEPVVNAVIFYSPTCPHCHQVINQDLPPLRQKYGTRLVIVGVDVSTQRGSALYDAMVHYFALPDERLGVPALVVGTTVLVGSLEIPQQLPGIVDRGLAAGGIDWPPIEELRQALTAQGIIVQRPTPQAPPQSPLAPADTGLRAPSATGAQPQPQAGDTGGAPAPATSASVPAPTPADAAGAAPADPSQGADAPAITQGVGPLPTGEAALPLERSGPIALFLRDPVGNGMSVAVLVGLLGVLAWSVVVMLRPVPKAPVFPGWLFPALGVVGIGVAAYLSFVEVTGAAAVCGPVGDCNTVQQSPWARLFGVLPIGVLGLAGYAGLAGAWVAATWGPEALRARAWTAAWAMALVGTAFSAYLTFLEPFVIGATCAWCLTSALVIALMLAVATERASAPPPA
ncbi:MAG TPA: vitamin K epoxide reductase family protein [Longimicrobiales bacterium]|nr:vitamin K epoxide reductase family protein [Longimicrobiales bacterium]